MPRKIAILGGTGAEGLGLANRFARAGEHIIIGSRDAQRARDAAAQLRASIPATPHIDAAENAAAAAEADLAILTVPFSGQTALLKQLKPVWKPGTIVIDTTVPLAASLGGSPSRMLGVWQGSAAQAARELLPREVALAAAFHNLSAELLAGDAPVDCDILVCSDDDSAKRAAIELAQKIRGARAIDAGKLENARIVESITALLIGLNIRHKVHTAGVRFTGLPRE